MRQGSNWGPDRRRGSVLSCGLSQLRYHARPFKVLRDGLEIVTDVTGSKSAGFTHRAVWRFDAHGTIEIENEASCGPEPLPQYRFDPNAPVTWRLFMAPQGS